ncbi:hypothetical protein CPB83DRAFT_896918, partial [Crepidotus variabilis]
LRPKVALTDATDKAQKAKRSAKSKWSAPIADAATQKRKKHGYDHIETYLSEPVITREAIDSAGGYLKYWVTALGSRKDVAQMALV